MPSSKLQDYTRNRLMMTPHSFEESIRPEWLTTSEGSRLELDFFIPFLNTAIEVQGKQHFSFVEFFHRSKHDYNSQIQRDKDKRNLCIKNGVRLVEVFQESDIDNFVSEISYPDVSPIDYSREPSLLQKPIPEEARFFGLPIGRRKGQKSDETKRIDNRINKLRKRLKAQPDNQEAQSELQELLAQRYILKR